MRREGGNVRAHPIARYSSPPQEERKKREEEMRKYEESRMKRHDSKLNARHVVALPSDAACISNPTIKQASSGSLGS